MHRVRIHYNRDPNTNGHLLASLIWDLLRRRRNFERVQTREVPEVLFNRDVKRISDLVADPVLRAFAGGICVFGGRKGVPPASRSARNLSVCPSVRVMSQSFLQASFGAARWLLTRKYAKKSLKKRLLEWVWAPNSTTFGVPHMMSLFRISVNLRSSLTPLAVNCVGLVCLAGGATCPAGSF